jgi:hypothetical protein
MEQKIIPGVYCDIGGTLLQNGAVNQAVLKMLKDFEAEGKQIILWTNGNLDEIRAELNGHAIGYKLRSKNDFAGMTVEIAIDDMGEEAFSGATNIRAEKFIKISSSN